MSSPGIFSRCSKGACLSGGAGDRKGRAWGWVEEGGGGGGGEGWMLSRGGGWEDWWEVVEGVGLARTSFTS